MARLATNKFSTRRRFNGRIEVFTETTLTSNNSSIAALIETLLAFLSTAKLY